MQRRQLFGIHLKTALGRVSKIWHTCQNYTEVMNKHFVFEINIFATNKEQQLENSSQRSDHVWWWHITVGFCRLPPHWIFDVTERMFRPSRFMASPALSDH